MVYTYKTQGVCSAAIELDIAEDNVIREIQFHGGCNGNAKGVCALVKGRGAEDVAGLLDGIICEGKATSCPDQLSRALKMILENQTTKTPAQ